jgi:hypothetical protein
MPLTRESSNRQNKQLTEQATDQTSNRQKKIKHIERKATDGEKQPMEKSNQWRKATDGEKQPMEKSNRWRLLYIKQKQNQKT